MGVGYQGLQLALLAKRRRADFSRTITLGRQNHYLHAGLLREMFDRFAVPLADEQIATTLRGDFAEGLFQTLGAQRVDSMDASAYEGATVIHDLNRPIPDTLKQRYTCVIDFGTMEHVFNFPTALQNATDLLEVGGSFLSATVANNFLGHGFYQLSPELFMQYLPANGFTDVEVFLVPHREFPYLFRVADPRRIKDRVELVNAEPVMMCVLARKAEHREEAVIPIQSSYADQFWHGRDVSREVALPPADPHIAAVMRDMGQRVQHLLALPESISPALVHGFENSLHYTLVDPAKT
jgi:hypothetical protein